MLDKELGRIKRHQRLRKKVKGTLERPRVSVHRSLKNIYIQAIDDIGQRTLLSASTGDKKQPAVKGKTNAAKQLGLTFGKKLIEKGIQKVAFDRGGYLYHGRVKALADALREAGVQV